MPQSTMLAANPAAFHRPAGHGLRPVERIGPEGFIRHPQGFPLQVRRVLLEGAGRGGVARSRLGLSFTSQRFHRPGSRVEIAIPLRGETQRFRGEVVLVRDTGEGYEIGVWLQSEDDAARARIVEQICHIEAYLEEREAREGRPVNRERAARDWIGRFAASFPVF